MSLLTFKNTTQYIAQFVVKKGDLVVARLLGLAPNGEIDVPPDDIYDVQAVTVIDGNTYKSAPLQIQGAASLLAETTQDATQGCAEFRLVASPAEAGNQLSFAKTTLGPVTFELSKQGKLMQTVVVPDSFQPKTLALSDSYSIYAVLNGVTTNLVTTSHPAATITAISDDATAEAGYFSLVIT